MSLAITTTTPVEVIPLADIDGSALEPAKAYGTDEVKEIDGKPVFALPSIVVRLGGEILKTASVKVFTRPGHLQALQPVVLTGAVVVTPWTTRDSGSVRLSILADGVGQPKKD